MARLTIPKDVRGSHTRLYHALQDSHAWRALSHVERSMWLSLRRQLLKFNNGDIGATRDKIAKDGFTSPTTTSKCLRSLLAVGLLAKTYQGGLTHGGKECSLFRFTDEPCLDIPKYRITACKASNEWQTWKSVAEAAAAIKVAHAAVKNPDHRNSSKSRAAAADGASKLQRVYRSDTADVAESPFSDTANDLCQVSPIQPLIYAATPSIGRKPASLLALATARGAAVAASA